MNTQTTPSIFFIRGQFCSTLRRRAIWKVIGPALTASTLGLEGVLTTYIPLRNCAPDKYLRKWTPRLRSQLALAVSLVVSENSSPQPMLSSSFRQRKHVLPVDQLLPFPGKLVLPEKCNCLLSFWKLIQQSQWKVWSGRADGSTSIVRSLPSSETSPLLVLTRTQHIDRVAERLPAPIPIIPIPDSSSFFSCLEGYTTGLAEIPLQAPSLTESMALLSHVTSAHSNMLSDQETNIVSDLFPSLRGLSQAARTLEGWEVLVDYLGEARTREIAEFWYHDRACEWWCKGAQLSLLVCFLLPWLLSFSLSPFGFLMKLTQIGQVNARAWSKYIAVVLRSGISAPLNPRLPLIASDAFNKDQSKDV